MNKKKTLFFWLNIITLILFFSCPNNSINNITPANDNLEYIVFAWNDLGMHCLNSTYDKLVILPPFNTIEATVIKRGNPPIVVSDSITVEYTLVNNSASYTKQAFGQFWDNMLALFGTTKDHDIGLTDNGLSGNMTWSAEDRVFRATGIPIVPVNDDNVWNPYQQAIVTVKDNTNKTISQAVITVPTSDEINCGKCHGNGTMDSAFNDILATHDANEGTTLASDTPILCASCHDTPALGISGAGMYLSRAIHGYHSDKNALCYDCHPGTLTKCSRSIAHTADDGNCIACHGNMANMANTIINDNRVPWANEPKCGDCHKSTSSAVLTEVNTGTVSAIFNVDTGSALYRNSHGHGDVKCLACHNSPHAMFPSRENKDYYLAVNYQGENLTIGTCAVCHSRSKGEGSGEFLEEHGGNNPERYSACNVCHTAVTSNNTNLWPHHFQWRSR